METQTVSIVEMSVEPGIDDPGHKGGHHHEHHAQEHEERAEAVEEGV